MGMILLLSVPLLVIYSLIKPGLTAKESGREGENKVCRILRDNGYLVLNNLIFYVDGRTVQIDHIAISRYGFLVIETKNHHGTICGDAFKKQWIQKTKSGTYEFYNPLWQNYGHTKALEKLLGVSRNMMIPTVVFSADPVLNVKTSDAPVATAQTLPLLLALLREPVFSDNDITYIYGRLKQLNCQNRKTEAEHIRSVKKRKRAA